MWRNTPEVIHHLSKSKPANMKGSIMFSKCNQFFPTGSKLSAAHCTKSHHGHQIHANPSLHQPAGGEGTQTQTVHKHTTCSQSRAPGVMRWNTPRTNRTETAPSIRPSDFDLILTHDVGHYVNSRACGSESWCTTCGARYSTIFPQQLLPWGQWASFLFSTCDWFLQLCGH